MYQAIKNIAAMQLKSVSYWTVCLALPADPLPSS